MKGLLNWTMMGIVTAAILSAIILAIGTRSGVLYLGNAGQVAAITSASRIAQNVELTSIEKSSKALIDLENSYSTIEINSERVRLSGADIDPAEIKINPDREIPDTKLQDVEKICMINAEDFKIAKKCKEIE